MISRLLVSTLSLIIATIFIAAGNNALPRQGESALLQRVAPAPITDGARVWDFSEIDMNGSPIEVRFDWATLILPLGATIADVTLTRHYSSIFMAADFNARTYIGNYEFTGDSLTRLLTPYGYFKDGHFYVNVYDYQGNLVASGGEYAAGVAQENSYYPYGLPVRGGGRDTFTPYLYGGKEFESRQGLNLYDFLARTYAPDEARFWQPDPKAGDYHGISPYVFCGADPINFVDPVGCDFWHTNDVNEITRFYNAVLSGRMDYDFSQWDHYDDIDFLNNLVYDDRGQKLYATSTSVENGNFIVSCTIYNLTIFPTYSLSSFQIYEPVNGILDEINYFINPWKYDDGIATWMIGRDGRINGLAPRIGFPPLIKKGRPSIGGTEKMGKAIKKMSGNRAVQKEQIDYLVTKYKLTSAQRRILHDEVSHEGLGFHELEDLAKELFNKKANYMNDTEKNLVGRLKDLLGKKVIYSRTGGGASSILLITFSNDVSLWSWRYWEISQQDKVLANSEDDDTPITGVMARAALAIENKSLIGFAIDLENEYQIWLCFEDDLDLMIFPEYETNKRFKQVINWELTDFPNKISYIITSELKLITRTEDFD